MYCMLKKCYVCLFQALCVSSVEIPTLSGRKVSLRLASIIKPTTMQKISGEGLPIPKQPGRRGDLIIEFDIQFPDHLTSSNKDLLSNALPN